MSSLTCEIDGCNDHVMARGWCAKHYTRYLKHGDANYRIKGEIRDGKRICPHCNDDKPLDMFSPRQRWCKACCAARKRSKPRPPVVPLPLIYCVECGTRFSPRTRNVICCTPDCALKRRHRFDREDSADRDRDEANASTRRWYSENKQTAFNSSNNYRARKVHAYVEDVDRLIVFNRDNWICQLCHTPIDPTAKRPDPWMASLDHRVPLAHGGKHSYENCQASHLVCNERKGARA